MNNTQVGTVTSVGMQKTVTVSVTHLFRHPLYKKAVVRRQKFAVHNEISGIAVGDKVQIRETKPVSRRKHFVVVARGE